MNVLITVGIAVAMYPISDRGERARRDAIIAGYRDRELHRTYSLGWVLLVAGLVLVIVLCIAWFIAEAWIHSGPSWLAKGVAATILIELLILLMAIVQLRAEYLGWRKSRRSTRLNSPGPSSS